MVLEDPWDKLALLDQRLQGLGGYETLPSLIKFGMLAFRQGQEEQLLDFSIPHYVRAAESVLALPKGGGANCFAERSLQLHDNWTGSDGFAMAITKAGDLEATFKQLYQCRNDCVHGKIPFHGVISPKHHPHEQQRDDDQPDSGISALAYFAERGARHAILTALFLPELHQDFASRETIEAQWKDDAWRKQKLEAASQHVDRYLSLRELPKQHP